MSGRSYFLTPGAVDDIREIGDWSLERWGKEKTLKYLSDLHHGLEYLAANFETFKNNKIRDELSGGSGLLLYPINRHYIAYIPIAEKTIAVAAVIRQGSDIPSILQKGSLTIHRDLQDISDRMAKGLITPNPADRCRSS